MDEKRLNEKRLNEGSRPVPDPTVLTTEALMREIAHVRDTIAQIVLARDEIRNERFANVANQFALIERQRIEQKTDTKAAVDAALIAQKEAVKEQTLASEKAIAKSEGATTAAIGGVSAQLNDLKDRITRIEGVKTGGTERSQNVNTVIIAVLSLATIASLILGLLK